MARYRRFFISGLIALIAGISWTFAVIYSQNNLLFNSYWAPHQLNGGNFRSGSIEELLSRQLLAGYKLNVGSAGERNQVVTKKILDGKEIDLVLEMGERAQVILGTIAADGSMTAVRLSRNPLLPSLYFTADPKEKVLHSEVIVGTIPDGVVNASFRDGELLIDGKPFFKSAVILPPGKLSLKVYDASVKDVYVHGENFSFARELPVLRFFLILFAIFFIAGIFLRRTVTTIALMGLLWGSFDFFVYSRKKFILNVKELRFEVHGQLFGPDYEVLRQKFFHSLYTILGGSDDQTGKLKELRGDFYHVRPFRICTQGTCSPFHPDKIRGIKGPRVFVFGGSLTAGWGTAGIESHYPASLQRELSAALKKNVTVLSLGMMNRLLTMNKPGVNRKLIEGLKPALILVEFSAITAELPPLKEILDTAEENKIPVLVFRAPMDLPSEHPEKIPAAREYVEKSPAEISEKKEFSFPGDETVLPLLQRKGVVYYDSNRYFLRPENFSRENFFVDTNHLTEAGHEVLGKVLAEEIRQKTGFLSEF